jgi:threonyl-tRNA synthetase
MKKEEQIDLERHSLAHLLAAAVLNLWPKARFGVGPVIENGFYYDVEIPDHQLTEMDLLKIEKRMKKLKGQKLEFKRREMSIDEAIKLFKKLDQTYKVELLNDLKNKGTTRLNTAEAEVLPEGKSKVSVYQTGEFIDLCRGPHLKNTSELTTAFKLDRLSGAYWRGSEENPMLTRLYGLAFSSQQELDEYSVMMEEAKKRDHRKLGRDLDLFVFSEMVGPGMPLYTPKGTVIRNEIVKFSSQLQSKIGYREVHTPQINKGELFKTSGHYDKFKDDMLMVKSHYTDEEYFLKPMNCPQHTQIYASQKRSYRDLPVRYMDTANLFRDEKPGELSGLTRLRCFSQDDSHCFCREDQIKTEFENLLEAINSALKIYGLDYRIRLSLWAEDKKEKYLGDKKVWEKSQQLMEKLLKDNKIKYESVEGEAAFYGPKMDIMIKDALKREWQISTIQLDLNMPGRFGLKYTDKDGQEKTPVMIHKAIVGSPERFMGILIEHYAGAFPLWLAPVQVKIVSVGSDYQKHCEQLSAELDNAGLRAETDLSNETVGNKIRKAVNEKVPYMLVIGDKELKSDKLMVRVRGQEKLLEIPADKFVAKIKKLIEEKSLEL